MPKNDAVALLLKNALLYPCPVGTAEGKPQIAIVNSYMEYSPGDAHLKALGMCVRAGIEAAGGEGIEIIIPGYCGELKRDPSVRRYYFAYRDFAAAMVEFMVGFHDFAGAVFLCTCDNQAPAFLLGAMRVNIPSIFVTGGYMMPGRCNSEKITAFSVAKQYGKFQNGECTEEDLNEMVRSACPTCGACPELGTANTMCVLTEALGMSLPGNSTTPAQSDRLNDLAFRSGERILKLVQEGLCPRHIISEDSLRNAIRVCLAMGGSTNAVIHTIAFAREIGSEIGLDDWDSLSDATPFICSISPNQSGYFMDDLDTSGGLAPVLKVLEPLLKTGLPRVSGMTLREELADVAVTPSAILTTLEEPFSPKGGLTILKGNLAPSGGILKISSVGEGISGFTGNAVVFECEEDGMDYVLSGKVRKGDVIVVRYEGPCAGPGSRECVSILHALVGLGLQNDVALVTDGRLSGTNLGLAVCNISPEAVKGTALAVVEDGDRIVIDIEKKSINLVLAEEEIARRLACWKPPVPEKRGGVLALYAKNVSQLSEGARII